MRTGDPARPDDGGDPLDLGHGFHATVVLDPASNVVSKRLRSDVNGGAAAAAAAEHDRLTRMARALAHLPFLRCPEPLGFDAETGTVRMSYCPGRPLVRLLEEADFELDAHVDHIAEQVVTALETFVHEFGRPYHDLTAANMLYDVALRTLCLIDFTPLDDEALEVPGAPYEVSLGHFVGVGVYETVRPVHVHEMRRWRREQRLTLAVVRRIAGRRPLRAAPLLAVADDRYRILSSFGGPARRLWYTTLARVAFRWRSRRLVADALADAGGTTP